MTRSGWEEERFSHLEEEVRALCQQIEHLAALIPDKRDRAYAGVAQECLWTMYRRAYERAVAGEEAKHETSDGHRPPAGKMRLPADHREVSG